jgi:hypothetical protein
MRDGWQRCMRRRADVISIGYCGVSNAARTLMEIKNGFDSTR